MSKRAPRKPEEIFPLDSAGFWFHCGFSDCEKAWIGLQDNVTPQAARQVARWLIAFANWAEYRRRREANRRKPRGSEK